VPVHLDHLHALLDGYESVRPLSDEEAAALAPMTALCHAEFALSEADYFLGVLHSEEKGAMACDGWLVGHARWFRSAGGKKLLDAIRRWAASASREREPASMTGCHCELLAAHWLEIAGFLTTWVGIWLTTRACSSAGRWCWPRTFSTCRFLSRAALFRCAAAGFLCGLHALRLVALVARRARRGRGARGSAACAAGLLGWLRARLARCCWDG
jgi:hypothetical protein